jgi:hypothetical protein
MNRCEVILLNANIVSHISLKKKEKSLKSKYKKLKDKEILRKEYPTFISNVSYGWFRRENYQFLLLIFSF